MATGGRWTAILTLVLLGLLALLGGSLGRWSGILGIVSVLVLTPTGERIGLDARVDLLGLELHHASCCDRMGQGYLARLRPPQTASHPILTPTSWVIQE